MEFVFSYYWHPTFYHYPKLEDHAQVVHFPWAVPDQFVVDNLTKSPVSEKPVLFGAINHEAYSTRKLCIDSGLVRRFDMSGCENKKMSDEAFYQWLQMQSAVVAAGSDDPKYQLVTPKYFETCAVGALLIGEEFPDCGRIGFDDSNSILFNKENMMEKITSAYEIGKFDEVRAAGLELIKSQHMVSHRVSLVKEILGV